MDDESIYESHCDLSITSSNELKNGPVLPRKISPYLHARHTSGMHQEYS